MLLAGRDRVALSPDGHGGTLRALDRGGCLDDMRDRGVDTVFYLQVDNPMVAIADPGFVGAHRLAGVEVTSKVVRKRDPDEKVGVVAERDGHQLVIEYSDLPQRLATMRRPDGELAFAAGSIAVHLFALEFIAGLAASAELPYHRALKPVPYVDEHGRTIEPPAPNAVKFEQFIFDTLAPGAALAGARDGPGGRVRAAEERVRARVARDRAQTAERRRRGAAGADGGGGVAPPRRLGGRADRDQPAGRG